MSCPHLTQFYLNKKINNSSLSCIDCSQNRRLKALDSYLQLPPDSTPPSKLWACATPGCSFVGCTSKVKGHIILHCSNDNYRHPVAYVPTKHTYFCFACNISQQIVSSASNTNGEDLSLDSNSSPRHNSYNLMNGYNNAVVANNITSTTSTHSFASLSSTKSSDVGPNPSVSSTAPSAPDSLVRGFNQSSHTRANAFHTTSSTTRQHVCTPQCRRDRDMHNYMDADAAAGSASSAPPDTSDHQHQHMKRPAHARTRSPSPNRSAGANDLPFRRALSAENVAEASVGCSRGLQNLGNTCYMNAALQTLANCEPLREFFLRLDNIPREDNKPRENPTLAAEYGNLMRKLWQVRANNSVAPQDVLYEFRLRHPTFRSNPFAQQDSHEFLRCFLDTLHAELREPVLPPYADEPDSDESDECDARGRRGSREEDAEEEAASTIAEGLGPELRPAESLASTASSQATRRVDSRASRAAHSSRSRSRSPSSAVSASNPGFAVNGAFGPSQHTASSCAVSGTDSNLPCSATSSALSPRATAYDKHCRRVLDESCVEKEAADSSADARVLERTDDSDSAVPPSTDSASNGPPTPDTTSLNSTSRIAAHPRASIGEQPESGLHSLKSHTPSSVAVSLTSSPASTSVDMRADGLPTSSENQCPVLRDVASNATYGSASTTSTNSSSFVSVASERPNLQSGGSGTTAGPSSSSRSHTPSPKPAKKKRPPRLYRSIISDVFEGKLISTVQCQNCKQVSTNVESFEDLSLPIPKSRVFDALAEQQLSLIASVSPPPTARSSLPSTSASSKHPHHKHHTPRSHQHQHSSQSSATTTASSPSAHASNDGDGEPSPLSSCTTESSSSTHASADSTGLNGPSSAESPAARSRHAREGEHITEHGHAYQSASGSWRWPSSMRVLSYFASFLPLPFSWRPARYHQATCAPSPSRSPSSSPARGSPRVSLHASQSPSHHSTHASELAAPIAGVFYGVYNWLAWIKSKILGDRIRLFDCLAAFFSPDELKNENRYNCEKCKSLQNGIKYSMLLTLPEVLCLHLKRFKHESGGYTTKLHTSVDFPACELDLSPLVHPDCRQTVRKYDLIGVVCHHGSANGGHYTARALGPEGYWFEYDDSYVTQIETASVLALTSDAYLLFYKKRDDEIRPHRTYVNDLLDAQSEQTAPGGPTYYVSKAWIERMYTFAEPGPIDNSDIVCPHGDIQPRKHARINQLLQSCSPDIWNYLQHTFGSLTGPLNFLRECARCRMLERQLKERKLFELETYTELRKLAEARNDPMDEVYYINILWIKQWWDFVHDKNVEEPDEIDNHPLLEVRPRLSESSSASASGSATPAQISDAAAQPPQYRLKRTADSFEMSSEMWSLLHSIYGGGPAIIVERRRREILSLVEQPPRLTREGLLEFLRELLSYSPSPTPSPSHSLPQHDEHRALAYQQHHSPSQHSTASTPKMTSNASAAAVPLAVQQQQQPHGGGAAAPASSASPTVHSSTFQQPTPSDGHTCSSEGLSPENERGIVPVPAPSAAHTSSSVPVAAERTLPGHTESASSPQASSSSSPAISGPVDQPMPVE